MAGMMAGRLAGKVACITGAASGIGRATALLFAAEGASVIAADRDAAAGDGLLAELGTARDHAFLAFDVSDEPGWIDAAAQIEGRFGRLDALVNNAGIVLPPSPVTEITLDAWRRLTAINLDGVFLGTKHMLPLLRASGGGSIVNLSSIAGIKPSANASAYAASKGAVRAFTKAVALECGAARDGVRVNSVHPGIVETAIWDSLIPAKAGAPPRAVLLDGLASSGIPLGRVGRVEEIAAGILWLASDESSYMTGSELVLDGGRVIA